ncbi:MAG: hypothetical protein IPJ19_19115 [Planctomycetes bacterium]|nr:hypothetical protein [Planctomycetota bacterium]
MAEDLPHHETGLPLSSLVYDLNHENVDAVLPPPGQGGRDRASAAGMVAAGGATFF